MKVICIDNPSHQESPNIPNNIEIPSMPIIPIGKICTVIDTTEYKGVVCYKLAEYLDTSFRFNWWYDSKYFIQLSDIDETELIKERDEILMKL